MGGFPADHLIAMAPRAGSAKQQTPQEAIDEFWSKFTTKTPGRGVLSHGGPC
jgi:hypothetical protein